MIKKKRKTAAVYCKRTLPLWFPSHTYTHTHLVEGKAYWIVSWPPLAYKLFSSVLSHTLVGPPRG